MIYLVTARFIESETRDFYEKLLNGSIESQRPDGMEIVASMRRARLVRPGVVQWYETCFCPTPLEHERETVYDQYFEQIRTREVDEREALTGGESFWAYLRREARDD